MEGQQTTGERLTLKNAISIALGGLTAGSAFALATGCTFVATAAMALGAVAMAFFAGDDDDDDDNDEDDDTPTRTTEMTTTTRTTLTTDGGRYRDVVHRYEYGGCNLAGPVAEVVRRGRSRPR